MIGTRPYGNSTPESHREKMNRKMRQTQSIEPSSVVKVDRARNEHERVGNSWIYPEGMRFVITDNGTPLTDIEDIHFISPIENTIAH